MKLKGKWANLFLSLDLKVVRACVLDVRWKSVPKEQIWEDLSVREGGYNWRSSDGCDEAWLLRALKVRILVEAGGAPKELD